jgi:(2Fe-2S) ferredoxin
MSSWYTRPGIARPPPTPKIARPHGPVGHAGGSAGAIPVDLRLTSHHPAPVPARQRYLFVCVNRRPDGTPKGSCATRGAVEIYAALKEQLKEAGLARLGARACSSSCLDVCWAGPAVAVEPDGFFYGRVMLDDVPEIVASLREGRRIERLVLPPGDFDEATARPPITIGGTESSLESPGITSGVRE